MTVNYVKTNLYKIRYSYGLTVEEFADILGVSKATVSNWERGKSSMNNVTAYGIIYIIDNLLPTTEGDRLMWKQRRLKWRNAK